MTVPYEDDTPQIEPNEPNETRPEPGEAKLEYGGDIWVKIMSWIVGGGLAVVVVILLVALINWLVRALF